jgi:hypothetical protein
MDFTKWLEKADGSPREVSEHHHILINSLYAGAMKWLRTMLISFASKTAV